MHVFINTKGYSRDVNDGQFFIASTQAIVFIYQYFINSIYHLWYLWTPISFAQNLPHTCYRTCQARKQLWRIYHVQNHLVAGSGDLKNVTHSYKAKMDVKHAFWYITCVSYSFGLNIMLYICYIKSLVQGSKPFSQLIKWNFLSYWQTKLSVCIWK